MQMEPSIVSGSNSTMLRFSIACIAIIATFTPHLLLAAPPTANDALANVSKTADKAGVEQANVSTIIGAGVKGALQLVGIFFFVLMVYGGFIWMTARGNDEKVTKARETIWAAVIGLGVTVAAYAVTLFVGKILK